MSSLKERYLLSFAILAPLCLIAFLVFKPHFDASDVPDPQYDILFSAVTPFENGPDHIFDYIFEMNQKRLQIIAVTDKAVKDKLSVARTKDMFIFRFRAKTGEIERIPFDATEVKEQIDDASYVIDIPEIQGLKLSLKKRSPDGYEFARKAVSRAVFVDVFVGGAPLPVIKKDGRIINIPIDFTRFSNIQFRGWILSEDPS